uniref:Movement protein TGBp3 n=1 Tax=Caper carlavirus 1 TaxID=2794419 RepID=A0A7T5UG84_9VIRU|nr:TGB3 [Caper carlavirus 1]
MQPLGGLLIFVIAFVVAYLLLNSIIPASNSCVIRVTGESATVNSCGTSEELAVVIRALGEALRSS